MSIATLSSTMGYGEISTENSYENLVAIFGITTSMIMFAYYIDQIYEVLIESKEITIKY